MRAQRHFQEQMSSIASKINTAGVFRALVLALAILLLPSFVVAEDTDLGNVDRVNVDGKDADIVNYYRGNKGVPWHLFRRPDGSYYMKSKGVYAEITGARVKTSTGTYTIPDKTGNERVDNFRNDVNSFIGKAIASLPGNSPAAGDSFFPLNLPAAFAAEGDNSGLWENAFTKTNGIVGFEMVSNELSILGSLTSNGSTPMVYSFDTATENWALDVNGGTEFTFAVGNGPHAGEDYARGWVFGTTTTPEPATLALFGSGVLCLGGFLRKGLLTQS